MEHFILKMIDKLPDMEMKINVRDYPQVRAYHPESNFGLTKYPMDTMPRDHGKPSVTIFWLHENSWEPTVI